MDVSVENLLFFRDGRRVLDIPELRFPDRTVTAVFGPNGSGKTTLLRLIAGIERPSDGVVRVGELPAGNESARTRVGMTFQTAVFVRGSVRHNLDLALRLRRIPLADREIRIEEAARECGVASLLDRAAAKLSGGEAQRVNLARVLALRAPVTLLDEPLAGLDRIARTQLLADLPPLLTTFAATTILVTHDREEAFRLADRLVVVIAGVVKAAGPKSAVYAEPPDRQTAELLGYTVLPAEGQLIAIPPGGLRPGDGEQAFTLVVDQMIDMGNHMHVVGRIGNERVDLRLPASGVAPAEGTQIRVHAGSDAVWLKRR
jgi:ABC-type sugar transport system ATPase subunit